MIREKIFVLVPDVDVTSGETTVRGCIMACRLTLVQIGPPGLKMEAKEGTELLKRFALQNAKPAKGGLSMSVRESPQITSSEARNRVCSKKPRSLRRLFSPVLGHDRGQGQIQALTCGHFHKS